MHIIYHSVGPSYLRPDVGPRSIRPTIRSPEADVACVQHLFGSMPCGAVDIHDNLFRYNDLTGYHHCESRGPFLAFAMQKRLSTSISATAGISKLRGPDRIGDEPFERARWGPFTHTFSRFRAARVHDVSKTSTTLS